MNVSYEDFLKELVDKAKNIKESPVNITLIVECEKGITYEFRLDKQGRKVFFQQ